MPLRSGGLPERGDQCRLDASRAPGPLPRSLGACAAGTDRPGVSTAPKRRDRDALRHSGASPVNNTAQVPELIAIVGPIASGKSTIAYELGSRFRAAGRAVAVLDLDDVVDTIGGVFLLHFYAVGEGPRRSPDHLG